MNASAYPIVYIDCGEVRLYGELVQHMEARRTCWLRPLSLRQAAPAAVDACQFLDVSNGPDIICADHIIQPVLDTDWLAVLAHLSTTKTDCDYPQANQYLREFLACLLT